MAKKSKGSNAIGLVKSNNSHQSVSVRKIANGYVVSHNSDGPNGEYNQVEHFHTKKPNISVSGVAPQTAGGPTVRKPRTVGSRKRATAKGAAQRLAGLKL